MQGGKDLPGKIPYGVARCLARECQVFQDYAVVSSGLCCNLLHDLKPPVSSHIGLAALLVLLWVGGIKEWVSGKPVVQQCRLPLSSEL